jgi:hypothetical protein
VLHEEANQKSKNLLIIAFIFSIFVGSSLWTNFLDSISIEVKIYKIITDSIVFIIAILTGIENFYGFSKYSQEHE